MGNNQLSQCVDGWPFGGFLIPCSRKFEKSKFLPKSKKNLWQVIHDCLPTREQILIRHGNTSGRCPFCDELESVDHLLFQCPLATFDCVRVGASAVMWSLWTIGNKLIFEGKILK
jgi:hypothetical protein